MNQIHHMTDKEIAQAIDVLREADDQALDMAIASAASETNAHGQAYRKVDSVLRQLRAIRFARDLKTGLVPAYVERVAGYPYPLESV